MNHYIIKFRGIHQRMFKITNISDLWYEGLSFEDQIVIKYKIRKHVINIVI